METLEEDIEVALDILQYQQRSQNEENRVLEDDINDYNSDNSSTCADESDYLNRKRKMGKNKLNKNGSSLSSASEHNLPTRSMWNECFINGVKYKCRTCFDPGPTVYPIAEECRNSQTWGDFLTDIVKLNTNNDELLPKTICSKCLEKLISYYDFILHVHNVNEKFHQLLASAKHYSQNDGLANSSKNITQCLPESATALPLDQCVSEIKLEDEHVMSYDVVLNNNYDGRTELKKEDTCDSLMETLDENIELSSDKLQYQERSQNEEINRVLGDSRNSCTFMDESNCLLEKRKKKYKTSKSRQRFVKKKNDGAKIDEHPKTARENRKDKHKNKTDTRTKLGAASSSESEHDMSNRTYEKQFYKYFPIEKVNSQFECGVCKKSFSRLESCRRHIILVHCQDKSLSCGFCGINLRCKPNLFSHLKRIHPDESLESNKKQLGRLFGERLYSKPLVLPRAECKLCGSTFMTKKQLLQHLDHHSEARTLDSLKLSSDITQRWFSNISDLQDIKTTICKDIREKNLFKYYAILNEFSYEISISDTDAEDLEEETKAPANKYKCELCGKNFLYKYHVFGHMRKDHMSEIIPFKCSRCKMEFISTQMYEQHKQAHCRNEHKLLSCSNCPGKFVWHKNMKKHNCATKILSFEKSESYEYKILSFEKSESYNEVIPSLPKTTNVIRCGLCEITLKKLRDLRQHMPLHADGKTGVDFNGCIYVNQFENVSSNRELLEQKIKNAFTKRQISQLYQAIDKYGKEMDISDSDSDEDDADGEKSYLCELCYATFKKRKLLLNHQEDQHKDVSMPFTCKECRMQYVSTDLLRQHIKRECWNDHRRVAEQCDCCKERFIWPENMLRHKEIQRYINIKNSVSENLRRTEVEKLISSSDSSDNIEIRCCFLCPKTFSNTDNFNDHLDSHGFTPSTIKTVASTIHSTWWPNGRKTIKCKICGQEFSSMAELNEHYSLKNLKNVCGAMQHSLDNYSITNQMGFELHLELDSETETECIENEENREMLAYRCCICSKSFKRKYQISQHQRSMHNYELLQLKCERCFFRTVSQKVLDCHKVSQCFNVEKMYKCDQCNFKFMWQENLEKHISIFHTSKDFVKALDADSATILNEGSNINDQCLELYQNDSDARDCIQSKDVCKCLICGNFITKESCSEHLRKHKYDKSYNCDFCEMSFLTNGSLNRHKRMHAEHHPFKCTLCEKHFRRQEDLRLHKLVHTGRTHTGFKCDLCDKSFKVEYNAIIHRRSHFNERPFKCTLCEKSFANPSRLRDHMRNHTGERPYQCTICREKFMTSFVLKKHSVTHVKNTSHILKQN